MKNTNIIVAENNNEALLLETENNLELLLDEAIEIQKEYERILADRESGTNKLIIWFKNYIIMILTFFIGLIIVWNLLMFVLT